MKRELIDAATGEVLEYEARLVPRRAAPSPFGRSFALVAQEAFKILKQIKSSDQHRVMMAMLERLDFDNLIAVKQTELAKELEMQKQNVNRAIKGLVKQGLLRSARAGKIVGYQLNPTIVWKGSSKNHTQALREAKRSGFQVIDGGLARDPNTKDMFEDG